MDAVHRTGVFYQAMPAVGADGKNIMKLIPVQMVNGQFLQTQISNPKTVPTSQNSVTINLASAPVNTATKTVLSSSVSQQIIRKQVSLVNVLSNQVNLGHNNSLNKHSLQQQTVNLMAEVPSVTTVTKKSGMPVRPLNQLPVTVKSPVLPRGQYLQIPPNAHVQMVPASKLPPGIQKQIFTSSASSSPGSAVPSVVYVSPVTTVNQGATQTSDSADPVHLLSNAGSTTVPGLQPKEAQQQLKLISTVSQRSSSPTRWVIEEEDASAGSSIKPLHSPSVTSEILRAVAERENSSKQHSVFGKTVSLSSQDTSVQGQENALVMCNGKVFFVAKKCTLPSTSTAGSEFSKTTVPQSSSQQLLQSPAPHTRQELRTQVESDEVIDLCDDDDELPQQVASVRTPEPSHLDEDNVIFVSYIPPKSESCSAASRRALRGAEPGQSVSDRNEMGTCGLAGMSMNVQQSASTQQLESIEIDEETESPTDLCSSFQMETNSHIMEDSTNSAPLAPSPCQVSDHLLRQIFGITAEVKICLQRVDEVAVGSVCTDPLDTDPVRSADDGVFVSQETNIDGDVIDVERAKLLTGKELPPAPHTGMTLIKCSHAKLNQNTPHFAVEQTFCSGQSSYTRTSCDPETEPATGCVGPTNEDLPCTNENAVPQSQETAAHLQTQNCLDRGRNTRRMGRTRKRTVCPCCLTTTLDPAVKSSSRSEELQKCLLTAEQMNRRGGRAKVARKEGRAGLEEAKNKHNCSNNEAPACVTLSSASMGSDELKRQEEIRRLKDILKEKEAALERMRKRMS